MQIIRLHVQLPLRGDCLALIQIFRDLLGIFKPVSNNDFACCYPGVLIRPGCVLSIHLTGIYIAAIAASVAYKKQDKPQRTNKRVIERTFDKSYRCFQETVGTKRNLKLEE